MVTQVHYEIPNAPFADVFAEQVFNDLGYGTVWKSKRYPLVYDPGSKAVPKQAACELPDSWR